MAERPSPLQNRVTPFSEIVATGARGTMFGNRGGKIHEGFAIRRRQASARWICCVLRFKGRRREVMGRGYTELFFLDEATAFAAGHRPCFECRRADAKAFAAAWADARGLARAAMADEMDAVLKVERREERPPAPAMPARGAMVASGDAALVFDGEGYRRWSFDGYGPRERRPDGPLTLLTPASAHDALGAGYRVALHQSAGG